MCTANEFAAKLAAFWATLWLGCWQEVSAVGKSTVTMLAAKLTAAWAFGFSDTRFTCRKCTGNVFTERTAAQWT